MELKELKKHILNNTLDSHTLVFEDENGFLSKEYIDAIKSNRKNSFTLIDNLDVARSKDSIFDIDSTLYIYKCDILDNDISDIPENLIISCKKVDKKIRDNISKFIVHFDKPLDWQIEDYCKVKAAGVSEEDLKWLISVCNNDIFRIDNELNKITIFNEKLRKNKFKEFVNDFVFSDLSSYNVFSISNALITRDINSIKSIYKEIDNIDVNAIGLVTILYNNFKNIINIQLGVNPTAQSLDMNPKQFAALKYRINHYSKNDLISIFNMLTSIDYRLKTGQIPAENIVDYVILKILSSNNKEIKLYNNM